MITNKKTILKEKSRILEMMNILEVNYVKLNQTNFNNVKYDRDDTQHDSVNDALLKDLQTAAESAGLVVTITTAKTGHPSNNSGKPSRHQSQTAVDVAIIDGVGSGGATGPNNGNKDFREKGNKLKDALVSLGYTWNTEQGQEKSVLWQTNLGGNHYNHVHVSNNSGESGGKISPQQKSSSDNTSSDIGQQVIRSIAGAFLGGGVQSESEVKNDELLIEKFLRPTDDDRDVNLDKKEVYFPTQKLRNIVSPYNGKIIKVDPSDCEGNIEIQISLNKEYIISLCGVKPTVSVNDEVSKGEKIGISNKKDITMKVSDMNGKNYKISYFYGDDKNDNSYDEKYKGNTKSFDVSKIHTDIITSPLKLLGKVVSGVYDNIKTQNKKSAEVNEGLSLKEEIKKIKKLIK